MIERFLKAKHWQLFLLVFGLPFVIYMGWMVSFFSEFFTDLDYYSSSDFPVEMFNGMITMILLMMIPVAIQYTWFWSMAVGLQKKLPEGMKMKVSMFKVFFIIPVVFLLIYLLFMVMFLGNIENLENLEDFEDFNNIGLFIFGIMFFIGISLFVTFCIFYQFWFIAKTIKSAQLKKEAVFSEFVGEFFLIWFYPIGVWILQPMVNKIMEPDP